MWTYLINALNADLEPRATVSKHLTVELSLDLSSKESHELTLDEASDNSPVSSRS